MKNYNLNKYLEQFNIPKFSVVTNHDNFSREKYVRPYYP